MLSRTSHALCFLSVITETKRYKSYWQIISTQNFTTPVIILSVYSVIFNFYKTLRICCYYFSDFTEEETDAQSCPILCNPVDCNLPGSSVRGILQARILEWVAFPSPGDLPKPGIKPGCPTVQADSSPLTHWGSPSLDILMATRYTHQYNRNNVHLLSLQA